jgi:protein kinase-like protein/WD40 repeat protein
MGVVYKAYDPTLDRYVALKVLPPELVEHSDRVMRFAQEARSASALNHPHIISIYEIGETEVEGRPTHYIAMELVEGRTLREEIHDKRAPLRTLLDLLVQVADALAKAHAAGIVHRDLKPDNILVTPDGYAKIIDFGLAKLVEPKLPQSAASQMATAPRTQEGALLGTMGYISPEQVEGKPADHRSDIFSYGCILYEAVKRSRPFVADSDVDVLHKILHDEPPPIEAPPDLERIIRRCLAKDPEKRYQSIKDVAADLGEVDEVQPRVGRKIWPFLAATALIALVILVVVRAPRPFTRSTAGEVRQLSINLPADRAMWADVLPGNSFAISPDGKRIVYAGPGGLFIRDLDRLEMTPMAETKGARNIFFSPDGQWVGFGADGKLKKVRLTGGAVETICDAPALRGADWSEENTIVFSPNSNTGLFLVSAEGGVPRALTKVNAGEASHRWPQFLTGGKRVLFTTLGSDGVSVAEVPTSGSAIKTVVKHAFYGLFVPPDHLLYARGETIFAAPFDPQRAEVRGGELPLFQNVQINPFAAATAMHVSRSGAIVYLPLETADNNRQLVQLDRHGVERPISSERRAFQEFALSPDGEHLAAMAGAVRPDLSVYDMKRDSWNRLTSEGNNLDPTWTPDGKDVIFSSAEGNLYTITRMAADGGGAAERLYQGTWSVPSSVSPDGKFLLFDHKEPGPKASGDIWVMSLDDRKTTPLIATDAEETRAMFSPDGKWIVYLSSVQGKVPPEIYVEPFPRNGQRFHVASSWMALWSRGGRELIYESKHQVMAVDVKTAPRFTVGVPHVLFRNPYDSTIDVSRDGERFFTVKRNLSEGSFGYHLNVVLGDLNQILHPRP